MGCLDPRVIGELEREEKKRKEDWENMYSATPHPNISHQIHTNFPTNFTVIFYSKYSYLICVRK